jgi:VanZ family protein
MIPRIRSHVLYRFAAHPLIRALITLSYAAILTLVLVQSSGQPIVGPPAPPGPPSLGREILLTFGHIVGFGLFTALWTWTFAARLPLRRSVLLAVILALIYSPVTELAQSLVPDRSASLWDIFVNSTTTLLVGWGILRTADESKPG